MSKSEHIVNYTRLWIGPAKPATWDVLKKRMPAQSCRQSDCVIIIAFLITHRRVIANNGHVNRQGLNRHADSVHSAGSHLKVHFLFPVRLVFS